MAHLTPTPTEIRRYCENKIIVLNGFLQNKERCSSDNVFVKEYKIKIFLYKLALKTLDNEL